MSCKVQQHKITQLQLYDIIISNLYKCNEPDDQTIKSLHLASTFSSRINSKVYIIIICNKHWKKF